MLASLLIRDIVLIDRLEIRFPAGLSVLTGETGAGKSILLDACALALGGRGDGSLVRVGASQGQVTAVFDVALDHPARAVAQAADLDTDGDLILRRVQYADGRTRAFINDQPVSVQALKRLGAALVEIHGQHDERALVDPASHRTILDSYGGLDRECRAVADAARQVGQTRAGITEAEARLEAARAEAEFAAHSLDELTVLAPEPGEEETLSERRALMMQSEKVSADLRDAADALGGPASPIPTLSAALRKLHRRAGQAEGLLAPAVEALDTALTALDTARTSLEQAVRDSEFDQGELDRTEDRLFRLRGASRKFGVPASNLASLRDRFAADLAGLEQGEGDLKERRVALAAAEADYIQSADALSAGRVAAADSLGAAVAAELPPLRLERARFMARIETDRAARDPSGFDRVEFWVQTNPGSRAGPLMKVASGGELSRFLLALKVVLADRGSAPTLVFDEIDAGVGGAVSDAIGQRLARLATSVQVMAVTHAPQVAARAESHFLIAKEPVPGSDRVATRVGALDPARRREEIARMLAGADITDEARAAAERLMVGAEAP